VIELKGYHFHNANLSTGRATFVRTTLLKAIEEGEVELPVSPTETERFTMKELGIGYAILADDQGLKREEIPNLEYQGPRPGSKDKASNGAEKPEDGEQDEENPPFFVAQKFTFTVQFCWQEKLLTERLEARRLAKEQEQTETPQEEGQPQPDQVDVAGI
jgi:type IV pilus assembly protein PilM